MKKLSISSRSLIVLGLWALVSCGDGRDKAEISYHFNLSSDQAVDFKSDLREFALQNGYQFIDGSSKTKEERKYINRESESSGRSAGLVSQGVEIIDVTVEPKEAELDFFIFAKTSAHEAEDVSLTVIYNESSAVERAMVDNFSQSQFLRIWKQ